MFDMESLIARINELAHKSKSPEGLTEEEKKEQDRLRQEYLEIFRGNFKRKLENIDIIRVDDDGKPINN